MCYKLSIEEAALDPLDEFVKGTDDQGTTDEATAGQTSESATEDTGEPKEDGFQKRINKITADKYEEKRKREASDKRADELQRKWDELEAKKPTLTEPTLADMDYDEDAYNKASVSYQVQQQVAAQLKSNETAQESKTREVAAQKVTDSFNEQITALGKEDFDVKVGAIPNLPAGVADAIMQTENGAELAYHLASHLDIADTLSGMTSSAAMMELGRISSKLSAKPEFKSSAAPDPIEPVNSGSAIKSDINDEMSMSDWMAKFGSI